jgi:uncharacterized protein
MTDTFLFDTYAIMEIIFGNPKFERYIDQNKIINTFIFAELCYILFRNNYPSAEEYLDRYKKYIHSINPEIIKKAAKFRTKHKKQKVSMTDCIGYVHARELGIKFLTGDKEFENFDNVEFIKK